MSQKYLGMPNAVVLCVDDFKNEVSGRMYHLYQKDPVRIRDQADLLESMEALFDELRFPFPANSERHFIKVEENYERERMKKVMKDEEILEQHGDLGTFIIRVQHRQNSSWQGRITWVEEDKTLSFRSVWEMMKLIDEAMELAAPKEEEKVPSWNE